MFIAPRLRTSVLQKLLVEGVKGVIELDSRAQVAGKISLRVFDRSAGNNVRFDDYQDLEPAVAAELVLRAKQSHAPPPQPQPAYPGYPANPYPQYPQPYQAPPAGYPYAQPPPAVPQASAALSVQDIAGMAGQIDNNTLQALLASLSAGQQAPQAGGMPYSAPGMPHQVDINALLSSLQGAPGAPQAQPPAPAYGMPAGYMPQMTGTPVPPTAGHVPQGLPGTNVADTAAQVQNIMNSLAKHR
jgi:nuclear polyadenylated RNA-binding protein 3